MIILAVLISIVISYIYYKRTKPELDHKKKVLMIVLRSTAICFVLILLLNPVLSFEKTITSRSKVLILNDVSGSMNENTSKGEKTDIFKTFTETFNKKFPNKMQVYNFAGRLQTNNDSIPINDTKLISSVRTLLKVFDHELIQEIVLVSDGWFHDSDLSSIRKLNIPVSVCLPVVSVEKNDLSITNFIANSTGFENENQIVSVSGSLNEYKGPYNIEVKINGVSKIIKKYDYSSEDFIHEISIGSLKTGKNKLSCTISIADVAADTLKDVNLRNNKKYASINIQDSKKTVLCVGDFPDFDVRFIRNSVLKDEHLNFRFLLQKNGKFFQGNNEVELTEELSDEIGALIIANHGKLNFSKEYSEIITNFLKKKKGLIFLGDPDCGLENVLVEKFKGLPSNLSDQIKVTKAGKKIRIFEELENIQHQLPPMKKIHLKRNPVFKTLCVFEDGENSPAIVMGAYSGSRIIQFAVRDLWKWSMHGNDPEGYTSFILGCIKWIGLNDDDLLNIDLDKDIYFKGDNARFVLTAYNERMEKQTNVSAEIFLSKDNKLVSRDFFKTSSSGEIEYIADLDMSGEYKYRVVDHKSKMEKKGQIIVADNSSEDFDSGINDNLLKYIADISNGKVYHSPEDIELSESYSISNKQIREISLYNNLYFLLIFIGAFCLELYLRKRWGLI